jgi:hypothetical protein
VENLTPAGGIYFTPVWFGFHDGSFDSFDVGDGFASAAVEALAEGGDVSGFNKTIEHTVGAVAGVVTAPDGFAGAPVFDPGDSGYTVTANLDPVANRFFSFASMIIPSNDAFIGNDSPLAYEIFDESGAFNGTREILVVGSQVWDAGTEVNGELGAAFSALGGEAADETLLIAAHGGLGALLGTETVAGTTIDPILGDFTADGYEVARITVTAVPIPAALPLFLGAVGAMGYLGRRRQSQG